MKYGRDIETPRPSGRPLPVPLRPDPEAIQKAARASLTRAVLASGLSTLDKRMRPYDHAERVWPYDKDVALQLRAFVRPTTARWRTKRIVMRPSRRRSPPRLTTACGSSDRPHNT